MSWARVKRLLRDSSYRTYKMLDTRYSKGPRRQRTKISFDGVEFVVPDAPTFVATYKQIFVDQIYCFDPRVRLRGSSAAPRILDCGANVGLSVLYFKKLFPDSEVVAFEADPAIYECLEKNVLSNGLAGVELVNRAVWSEETVLQFRAEGSDAGRVAVEGDRNLIEVKATRLRPYLSKPVDLLKLDIEGAETDVVFDCADLLENVDRAFVEYHSFVGREQRLGALLSVFERKGFRCQVHTGFARAHPFVEGLAQEQHEGFDLLLNLFFSKA